MASDAYGVNFCGVEMDDATLDAYGVRWVKNSLEGWDSPPVRINDSDKTGRHGGYGPSRLYGARLLTLNGMAHAPDMATAFEVRDRLHAMPGLSGSGVLVMHEAVDKSLDVMLGGDIKVSMPMPLPRPYVRFQIPLVAHDPFKRGASHTTAVASGATVTAPNAGTAPADMRVTLTTGGTVILSAGGLTLTTGALPAGAVIDTGATSVQDSTGADLFTLVSLPPLWPAIPAGGGPVGQLGTADLSVVHFDTYA
jgi:hypothetical protein